MNEQNKVLEIVKQICNTESLDCRSLNKSNLALELLKIANVPTSATIQEIPLDKENQVVILFTMKNDNNYYSLFAGIGNNGDFCFQLGIDGTVKNNEITFYDDSKILPIDYFKTEIKVINTTTTQYVEAQKQEILQVDASIWSNNLVTELRKEYFDTIIEELNKGNKITQEVYEDLKNDNMNEWYLNKHYIIQGIKIIA